MSSKILPDTSILVEYFRGKDYKKVQSKKNCHLLSPHKRIFKIPRGKEYMGQANIWYAGSPGGRTIINKFFDIYGKYFK